MLRFMGPINRITRCLAFYRSQLYPGKLSSTQHSLVLAICRHPGCSQEEVATRVGLDKSTITRALAGLEERGYLTRTPNPKDKRELLVDPTEKMREAFPVVDSILNSWYTHLTDGVSEDELAVFHSVLLRIEKNARAIAANNGEVSL